MRYSIDEALTESNTNSEMKKRLIYTKEMLANLNSIN